MHACVRGRLQTSMMPPAYLCASDEGHTDLGCCKRRTQMSEAITSIVERLCKCAELVKKKEQPTSLPCSHH